MAGINGKCTPQFEKVRSLFAEFLESQDEVGASITVNIDGEDVVNIWGGYADQETKQPWVEDTIVGVFSCSKMVSALAVLMLIDSGAVSAYEKVSKYWPEFAANGKENVEIRHLLSHTSGVAGWDEKVTMDEICDPSITTAKLAPQAPWFEPGSASAYHCYTYGHLLGEIVRRVTGMSLKQFIAEKIAAPLAADFQLGVSEKDLPRVSHHVMAPVAGPPNFTPPPLFTKAIRNPTMQPNISKYPPWQRGENGAANGFSNAKALNKIFSTITLVGTEGDKQLLSKSTLDLIFQEQSNGVDLAIGMPIRFGIGYALKGDGDWASWMPAGDIAYWGGAGGSLGIMDVGRKLTITYAMNRRDPLAMIGNRPGRAYVGAVYEALGVNIPKPLL
ncbi:beta-lactamase [Xylaria sp. CBS 124048]|nr:beta-lactamase [Xylaria sp. CBS 124048]